MIVPSIAPTWRKAARDAKSSPAANAENVTSTATATATSAVVAEEAAGGVVREPREREPRGRDRDGLPRAQVGDGRIDEPRVRIEPVEDDEQGEAGEPRRVRLPLEPVQVLGQLRRRDLVLLRVVEAAAVHAPVLARDAALCVGWVLGRPQAEVEPDEVERRADPRDPGDDVQQPQDEVGEVSQVVRVHRSLAISQSARSPVSSSSSRVRAEPLAQHRHELRTGPAVDEDDEREAEAALVLLVQPLQLGEHLRLGAALLLGGLADPGVRRQRCDLIVLGERERHLLGDLERALALGELVHEPRSPREERRQLARRSAAAVARARVGRDEERDVVVALVELDLQLDALEER